MKLVKIVWLDHCSYSTAQWRELDRISTLEPVKVNSLGYVVKETKDMIIIASHVYHDDDDHGGQGEMCIIKKCIVSRVELTERRTRKTKKK